MSDTHVSELSEREQEILRLIATGASNKEIAQQLVISPNTVKVHARNIFAKIGAASRTEAAMYAVRVGMITGQSQDGDSNTASPELVALEESPDTPTALPLPEPSNSSRRKPNRLTFLLVGVITLLLLSTLGSRILRMEAFSPAASPTLPAAFNGWEERSQIPEARKALAAVVYEGQIYAIAGETGQGVSGLVSRYDPQTDQWTDLSAKPLPVADVGAALVGEKIYVPGGRTSSGKPTDELEVYDPRRDLWEVKAPLPRPLSGYTLVAFEGRLYLFGGWDGQSYLATVYEYDPLEDVWSERTSMPTARAFAGAAVAEEKIFIIGGWDGEEALQVNQVYYPHRDDSGESAWEDAAPMPEPMSGMGVASLADNIYLMGGALQGTAGQKLMRYQISLSKWELIDESFPAVSYPADLVYISDYLYLLGGQVGSQPNYIIARYRIVYTIVVPGVIK